MRGYYRVFADGKLISESPNIITDEGRRLFLRYMAGNIGSFGGAVALGTSGAFPYRTDKRLGFEFMRGGVELTSPDFANGRIIYKASVTDPSGGTVYELGLYPFLLGPAADFTSRLITGFEPSTEPLTGGTASTTSFRIGGESYAVTATASGNTTVTLGSTRGDFSGHGDDDSFSLAFFVNDANTSSIRLRFLTDAANYYDQTVSVGTSTGYFISEYVKGSFVKTGNPDWASIASIEFTVFARAGGATTVNLDGLRVNDNTIYSDYALVSRSVLLTPVNKPVGVELDIEYVLEFNV